jgi:hypothetical protein
MAYRGIVVAWLGSESAPQSTSRFFEEARRLRSGSNDSALLDEALAALLARHRAARIDAAYTAYDAHPIDEPDEWGDLASFREAARSS